jgi:DHA1 family tetracycline resistance protein-like MFS transporter
LRRATFVFVFFVVLFDMLAIGIIVPVLPKLVIAFKGGNTASAAGTFGLFGTVWAGMQFLFSPLIGALSDRYGRRPVILLSCLGLGLDYFVMALAPSLTWLFVGRLVSGITASSFATAFAYIADVTPPDERAGKFGMLGAAFGVGFILGPAAGGLLGMISLRAPFWAAGALSLLNGAYGLLVLPESLPPERRSPVQWARANPVGSLGMLRAHESLLGLAVAAFLYRLAHDAMPTLFVIFTDYRFGWNQRTVGLVLAAVGVASMIVQAGLVRPVVKRFGERRAMLAGLSFGALAFVIYGLAPTGTWFLVGIPLGALFGFSYPSLQGLMTRRVGPDEQGRLQGSLASLMGIAGVIAPILFTQVLALAIGRYRYVNVPGAPFLLAALLLVAAMVAGEKARPTTPNLPVDPTPVMPV